MTKSELRILEIIKSKISGKKVFLSGYYNLNACKKLALKGLIKELRNTTSYYTSSMSTVNGSCGTSYSCNFITL